jgi:cell division protein FtsX
MATNLSPIDRPAAEEPTKFGALIEHFSVDQCKTMVREDRMTWRTITAILISIVTVGFILVGLTVLFSG